jgi:hypothetical protein
MSEVDFAHPVERELARLFDEHHVRWMYEPHTFVLESDPDGTVREAFTPAAANLGQRSGDALGKGSLHRRRTSSGPSLFRATEIPGDGDFGLAH